jgi:hypothetical protein
MFSILNSIKGQHEEERRARRYRELIRREAKLGSELFGPVPEGVRREFFCLDEHTWVWHEEWTDQQSQRRAITTRYDVRPSGILKAQDGQPYRYVTLEEGKRLYKAIKMYSKLVQAELYS